jgi:hypothetical protein
VNSALPYCLKSDKAKIVNFYQVGIMFIFASVLLQIKLLMADERAKIFDPLRK